LRRRDATGEGAYLDIAMTDSLLTFEYWAIGAGLATGQWPGNATDLTTGGTPRYHLYETRDGRIVAAAPIEQRFWELFVAAIGLEPAFADDARDPAATTARIAEIMRSRDAAEWAAIFDGADCCCSIVQDVRTAMADAHFRARGLFAHVVINEAGARMPALPVPISGAFRAAPSEAKSAPALGAHNREIET
jgi:crotonobetainyl-CoA:carnitine CoA-transferase CaiB-like acyl-CoA transferase